MAAILANPAAAQAPGPSLGLDIPTHRFVLDNGLTVILAPDHHSEIVAVHLFYKVGSRDEEIGATGLAHLFEHMMFHGSARYGPKAFDATLERAGGYGNAYTSTDFTTYYTTVPPSSLATVLDLEADRMVGLDLNRDMLERERSVVLQERRQVLENRPQALLRTLLKASLFQAHPYRWPILGWVADIEGATLESCRAFYALHYAPNNAVLVLAGAVDPVATKRQVEHAFAALPRSPAGRRQVAAEPPRTFSSRVLLERDAPAPMLMLGFLGVRAQAPDHAVLDVLAEILVRGRTARLPRRLVRQDRMATGVDLLHDWTLDAGAVVLEVTLAQKQPVAPVIDAVFSELERLARDGVPADELERARTGASARLLRSLATAAGRADVFGQLEIVAGDPRACLTLPQRYAAIDSGQLRDTAARVFARERVAVAELRPPVAADSDHEAGR